MYSMGRAIPYAHRLKIVERCQTGHAYKDIANDLGISESGLKKFWYRYQKQGEAAIKTHYQNCGGHTKYGVEVRETVAKLRDNQQGAAYIRSKMIQHYPNLPVPDERTLQRWWNREKTNRPKGRPKEKEKKAGAALLTKSGK